MSDHKRFWVGFNIVKGIGGARLRMLLNAFGDAQSAWFAPRDSLRELGLSSKVIGNLIEARSSDVLDRVWAKIEHDRITLLTWEDEDYPQRLKEIPNTPPLLYLKGSLKTEDDWSVAIVGTRRITAYGREVTAQIASTLAHSGVTIVSGLARGIDAVAHTAALDAGGRTIAVLGCGVDIIYPPENRRLAERIIENGAILSDYPPGTPPEANNFPPRNRIISGISRAVIVVEAGRKSGALITARFAADQGKDVFAVPGNIFAPQSRGTNHLIQQGAHPLLDPKDVMEVLDMTMVNEQRNVRIVLPASATEAQLYQLLDFEPMHIDEITVKTALPIGEVSSTLALMELKGMVRQVGGMRYVAIRDETVGYEP
ncbi:MAG: DNA-processing protein DprA [Anaerolineales bacterium]|nr:DNA-processing protein DprA [Anaerolineales bacterium]